MNQNEFESQFVNKIVCGDCLSVMKGWPDKCVDLVLTDPPYGIRYKSNGGSARYQKRVQNARDWDNDGFAFDNYLEGLWRLLEKDADMYVFGNWNTVDIRFLSGFKQVLIWDKRRTGLGDLHSWGIGYELIFYFKKGNRHVNKRRAPVIFCESLASLVNGNPIDNYLHPTQKPLGIIAPLIQTSTNIGDLIIDPFCGSGTTCVAAKMLGRRYIGIDISEKYCEIARMRLEAVETGVPVSEQKSGQMALFGKEI